MSAAEQGVGRDAPGSFSLEERLALIENVRAIEELVYRYAELCDESFSPDLLAELFTDDATWSSSTLDGALDFGTVHGREQIRQNFAQLASNVGVPTLHVAVAPQITIAPDGLKATGKWRAFALLSELQPRADAQITFLGAEYEHEYRLSGGRWLFQRIAAHIHFNVPLLPTTLASQ